MLYSFVDVHFFFFFFFLFFFPPRFCPAHISGTVTRRDSKFSVLLGPAVKLCTIAYHPIRFVIFFFFFFFSAMILSGPYLWNHYSQRLQTECAAWSCGLILHCCLPSNSLRYWTKVRGIAPRSHTGRPRTCLVDLMECHPVLHGKMSSN